VNRPCPVYEPLLLDRAAGELGPADTARLERHLDGCPACRTEADAVALALSLAALPPVPPAERVALGQGAREALARHRAGRRERRFAGGVVLAVAASAAFALAVPWFLLSRQAPVARPAAVAASASWELPDLDAAWDAAAAADPDAFAEPEPEMLFAELQEIDFDLE
jgi:predicted anti-sigma-YlaC factor YlaD